MRACGRSTPAGSVVKTLIVGCGDTGVRVAARAVAAGDTVTGVVRTPLSAARVRSVGAHARCLDLDSDSLSLPPSDRLFYFAPPTRDGEADTRMARVLAALPERPGSVIYISTSGVYGDCAGAWVDETCEVAPVSGRAKRRVDAERRVRAFDDRAVILRAPGIYGPNRLPLERLRAGEPIVDDAEGGWSNRVHIDDLAAIAWQAAVESWPDRIYNACDGNPTPIGVFYDTLADMMGVARPPRISWREAQSRFSAMRLSFLRESRRLSNRRLLAAGYRMAFADFRDGLAASLRAETEYE